MTLFSHDNRQRSAESRRVYAMFELAHTAVDFLAALSFLAGSVLFFWKPTETAALWCFVIGSALFALKPTLRFLRELKLAAMGKDGDLAERYRSE